jgi:hypothetical protein
MRRILLLSLFLLGSAFNAFAGTGKVVIHNIDLPEIGFNDPTPVEPVGGNERRHPRVGVVRAAAVR